MKRFFAGMVILLITVAFPLAVKADDEQDNDRKKQYIYQWMDDKGIVHITDGLGNVPPKFRPKAKRVETPKKEAIEEGQQEQRETFSPYEGDVGAKKAYWQQRMREARARLANAERRFRDLEQEKSDLIAKWGAAAYAIAEDRRSVGQIERELEQVKQEIAEARDMINVVIPDEARREGALPGWLRE